jgi:hypothetical protein
MIGCDPTVTVVCPSDQHRYSLYGALNVAADTQVVRVDPILPPLDSHSLPVAVVLTNLDTGRKVPFRGSTVTIGDERFHNFWARTPVQPGTSYNVSVVPGEENRSCADPGAFAHPYAELMVAAGGPDWPKWLSVPLNEVARPDEFSNVSGGHGSVGGIYSDTIRILVSIPIARYH